MTARLELAEAIGNRMAEWGEDPLTPAYWEDLLDDLPADKIAEYAIERGALRATSAVPGPNGPTYRVVEL